VEKVKALPVSKQFWDDLFADAKKWGLVLYEQVQTFTPHNLTFVVVRISVVQFEIDIFKSIFNST